MPEVKTKGEELTDADLAAYGIPPKQTEGREGRTEEQVKEAANDPELEVSDGSVEKNGKD
ncbi:MAG: hypothetical protein WA609_01895 [Terriglobales bacterium]